MLPVIAIVGRPNVGKSTLFNYLTASRHALVSPHPGTTRDRQFGEARYLNKLCIVIDTGGLKDRDNPLSELIDAQTAEALLEANVILFVIDGLTGATKDDLEIAKQLKKLNKPVILAVNKLEKQETPVTFHEAFRLGFQETLPISAKSGQGITALFETIFKQLPTKEEISADHATSKAGVKLAIIGKPNVGKSTLVNRMLGETRVITHDSSGTTRDSIYIPLKRYDKDYILIDTAGVRKRKNITEIPEKYSVIKTLQSIEETDVVIYLIDAKQGTTEQDLKLLDFILDCGKALVIAINKWDGLSEEEKTFAKNTLDFHLDFISFARIHFISAKYGTGVGHLFESADEAYRSATTTLPTSKLTRLLQAALTQHAPPLVKGRRIKLRYAHAGGTNPPVIVIHGSQIKALPESYRTFLSHYYIKALKLRGTPLKIQFKENENPYTRDT